MRPIYVNLSVVVGWRSNRGLAPTYRDDSGLLCRPIVMTQDSSADNLSEGRIGSVGRTSAAASSRMIWFPTMAYAAMTFLLIQHAPRANSVVLSSPLRSHGWNESAGTSWLQLGLDAWIGSCLRMVLNAPISIYPCHHVRDNPVRIGCRWMRSNQQGKYKTMHAQK
jgi:hypothetical protein